MKPHSSLKTGSFITFYFISIKMIKETYSPRTEYNNIIQDMVEWMNSIAIQARLLFRFKMKTFLLVPRRGSNHPSTTFWSVTLNTNLMNTLTFVINKKYYFV